jgi:hypothetical protein
MKPAAYRSPEPRYELQTVRAGAGMMMFISAPSSPGMGNFAVGLRPAAARLAPEQPRARQAAHAEKTWNQSQGPVRLFQRNL